MHKNAIGKSRKERVLQVKTKEKSVYEFASYIPIDNAARTIRNWSEYGAEIYYLSPHKRIHDALIDKTILIKNNFPNGTVLYRKKGEEYKDVAERIKPDIIIEDDCESIGGEKEMVYPSLEKNIKSKIKSIVVHEFGGIDHLPKGKYALLKYNPTK